MQSGIIDPRFLIWYELRPNLQLNELNYNLTVFRLTRGMLPKLALYFRNNFRKEALHLKKNMYPWNSLSHLYKLHLLEDRDVNLRVERHIKVSLFSPIININLSQQKSSILLLSFLYVQTLPVKFWKVFWIEPGKK